MKPCSRCGIVKPFTDFYKNAKRKNGVSSECRECYNATAKAKRKSANKPKPGTHPRPNKAPRLTVQCRTCGKEFITPEHRIENGRGRFCSRECVARNTVTTHGHSRNADGKETGVYSSWSNMRARCQNPKHHKYHMYGAVGITVCERWQVFENFLEDMGERPEGMSIDRIDGIKGYYKENCRWATRKEQQNNVKSNIHLTINGKTQPLRTWAREIGIDPVTLRWRIRQGWPEQSLLAGPHGKRFVEPLADEEF